MRAAFLIVGFTIIFNYLFNINALMAPYHFFRNPTAGYSLEAFYSLAFVFNVAIPLSIVSAFIVQSGIHMRTTMTWGYKLFVVAVVVIVLTYICFGLTAFSWGVRLVYVPYIVLQYLALPAKLALVIGAIKILISLRSASQNAVQSKLSQP
ncbi:MAG: hypothetical protein ABI644_12810 [Arenimonas sp.]